MSILKTKKLVKIYGEEPNLVKALDNISFNIEEGKIICSNNRYFR